MASKRWEFSTRSDNGQQFVVRAGEQYAGMPGYGLVVGVYHRTTGDGRTVLLAQDGVSEVVTALTALITGGGALAPFAFRTLSGPDVTLIDSDQDGGVAVAVEHYVSRVAPYPAKVRKTWLSQASAVSLRDALTAWLNAGEGVDRR